MLHTAICRKATYTQMNGFGLTTIKTQQPIDNWSATLKFNGKCVLPPGATFDAYVEKQKDKYNNRIFRAVHIKPDVTREYVLNLLRQKIGKSKAEMHVKVFEMYGTKNDKVPPKRTYMYASQWIDYIDLHPFTNDEKTKEVMQYVKGHFINNLFNDAFTRALVKHGVPLAEAKKLQTLAVNIHRENVTELARQWLSRPYSPYLTGLSMKTRMSLAKGAFQDEQIRYEACCILTKREMNGDTYVTTNEMQFHLKKESRSNIIRDLFTLPNWSDVLCYDDCYMKPDTMKGGVKNARLDIHDDVVQHKRVADAERGLFDIWNNHDGPDLEIKPLDNVITAPCDLNVEQKIAFDNVFTKPISCVTGGPGTGKTYLTKALCRSWPGNVLVVSSNHQPLENLKADFEDSGNGVLFKTIASCMIYDQMGLKKPAEFEKLLAPALKEDPPLLLIVEEAGVSTMLDMYDILSLVLSCENVSIVFLGDDQQLKPIGPGQPFSEFIRFFPERTTRLVECKRTSQPNLLHNIRSICAGNRELVVGGDFIWFRDVPELRVDNYVSVHERLFEQYMKEFCIEKDVVIVHKNETRKLVNKLLHDKHLPKLFEQACLQRTKPMISREDIMCTDATSCRRFVCGSRVICVKTDKSSDITNGCRGIVRCRICHKLTSELESGDIIVQTEYNGIKTTNSSNLDLAYSVTAHKAQGSEYDTPYVYIPANSPFIARDWVYTAVSRAKKRVVYMVSEEGHSSVMSNRIPERRCMLSKYYKEHRTKKRTIIHDYDTSDGQCKRLCV